MKNIILKLFLPWLILLLLIGYFSQNFSHWDGIKNCYYKKYPPYFRWDSSWYTGIAQKGYTSFSAEKNSTAAFWPLYPATINFFYHTFNIRPPKMAFLLSICYAFLATILIYHLARLDYDKKESFQIILVFLSFPSSYYLITVYPESLFVLLAAVSLYLGRKKFWFLAGVASALLAFTKPYGALIMPVLFVEYLENINWQWNRALHKFDWLPLCFPAISVLIFIYYNYIHFNEPFAFAIAQRTWGRSFGNPVIALFDEAKYYLFTNGSHIFSGGNIEYLIYLFSFFFSILAFIISWKTVRKSYLLFTGMILLLALYSGTLTSWYRYMLLTFPILFGPALYLMKNKRLNYFYLAISLILLIIISSLFVRCYPVV